MVELSFGQVHPTFSNGVKPYVDDSAKEKSSNRKTPEEEKSSEKPDISFDLSITGAINSVCQLFCEKVSKLFNIFSPFIKLINGFGNLDDGSKKITTKDIADLLQGTQEQITKDKKLNESLSKGVHEALDRLYASVSVLGKREDLQNIDLTELIARWRQNKSSRELLEMARLIREGKCHHFKDEKLRKAFIESLELLGKALEAIAKHPPSMHREQARGKIVQAANPMVSNVELHNKIGGDANFTSEDRKTIACNFKESAKCVKEVLEDEKLSTYMDSAQDGLMSYVRYVYEFLAEWLTEKEKEEEKQEEKIQQEKLCKQKQEQKKEIEETCRNRKAFERKKNKFYFFMEEVKAKSFKFFQIKEIEKDNLILNSKRFNYLEKQIKKNTMDYDYARDKYYDEKLAEEYYSSKKQEIQSNLLPSYVCGNEELYNLELDLIC